ncbi:hypothetical protein FKR81_12210 [Lentzea tibetensis]|uniref:HTH cro/C1-type domain-containing protein n=1 Tax=Lentzea tibetensis TaxID=2591470 RepID=A0A563EX95_9PSEU|nr:helix-turn-helix domain-containing protein [Lentzea tibetensis]TWP52320.1 hypothetical protein FKR81_12210 [Lentzea tibetensis]
MPRRERPIGGDEGALSQFAGDLRRLRESAGRPTYRELARLAHYSPAALSEAAGGRKLPSLAVTLAYVGACEGDLTEWEERWREIAACERSEMGSTNSPYVGLQAFQPEDVDRFFGREQLTEELIAAVRTRPFVGVFGASGSGKSSVLRAGLVPRIGAPALVFTPGVHPADECAVRLAGLTGESAVRLKQELDADPANLHLRIRQWNPDLVLVVDQFEEVFTLASAEEREWFVRALTSGPRVVIGVRADFYGHCGRHPALVEALRGSQVLVGPMTPDELRRAITEPAARAGVKVETALVARLVADVTGQAAALPLVSHALVETWQRRRGMALALSSYEEAGGLEHAVARTAETVFRSFAAAEQSAARLLFLRLIALGDGTEDTKRRVPRGELDVDDSVLEGLASARLISIDRDAVELTHEALIRSWPRLRDWIAENRERLRVHRQLVDATAVWEADGRDPDALYRGVRLAQAKALGDLIGWREREFLTASAELEREHDASERLHTHRLRQFVAILAAVVLVLAGTVVYAVIIQREATRAANNAMSHRGAMEAMMLLNSSPHAAARTALAAYSLTPTEAARDALLSSYAASKRALVELTGPVDETPAIAPGGKVVVGRDNAGKYRLWSLSGYAFTTRGELGPSGGGAVFSADGRYVVTHDDQYTPLLWDISDLDHPRRVMALPGPAFIRDVNPSTGLVVATRMSRSPTGQTWTGFSPALWDIRTGEPKPVAVPGASSDDVVISPAGGLLAIIRLRTGGAGFSVDLARIGDDRASRTVSSFDVDATAAESFTFSPDGRFVAVLVGNRLEVWDVSTPEAPQHWGAMSGMIARDTNDPIAVAFGADSGTIVVASAGVLRTFGLAVPGSFVELGTVTSNLDDISRVTFQGERGFVAQSQKKPRELFEFTVDVDAVVLSMCGDPSYHVSDEDWKALFPEVPRKSVCE